MSFASIIRKTMTENKNVSNIIFCNSIYTKIFEEKREFIYERGKAHFACVNTFIGFVVGESCEKFLMKERNECELLNFPRQNEECGEICICLVCINFTSPNTILVSKYNYYFRIKLSSPGIHVCIQLIFSSILFL